MKTPETRKTRVLLVDDHPVVREGIRAILAEQKTVDVVGELSNGREVVEKAKDFAPDIILMDISMPEMNGFEATRLLRKQMPGVKIILLTMYASREYAREAKRLDIQGYVLKEGSPEELMEAIHCVMRGTAFVSPSLQDSRTLPAPSDLLSETATVREARRELSKLSPRETQVLSMIAEGHKNREIAERLGISIRTVETHRQRILRKLALRGTAALTKLAVAAGMVGGQEN